MFLLRKVKLPLMSASKVKRKKWGQKKSLPGILFLILLMLVVFGGVSYKNGFFTIKRLDLKNSLDCVTIESLKRETGVINKSLFFINTLDLKKRIESKFSCVGEVKISKKYPESLELEFVPKIPKAVLGLLPRPKEDLDLDLNEASSSTVEAKPVKLDFNVNQSDVGGYFLTDKNGSLYLSVSLDQVNNLPIFYYLVNDIEKDKNVEQKKLDNLLTIDGRLKQTKVVARFFKVDKEKLLIEGQPKMVFSLGKDPLRQVASLQLILQKATMNSASIDTVDLRFDKPIVVYSGKK